MNKLKTRREYDWVKVSDLLFDSENPRLPLNMKNATQNELLRYYERNFDITPIAQSMVDNGFFREEPLILIKPRDKYVVVEGNRRLAALKFLTDPEMRLVSRNAADWEKLTKSVKYDLSEVPATIYEDRDQVSALLGFRHIAGIETWEPLPKARFIYKLVKDKGDKADFVGIGREIGCDHTVVRDNYIAYNLYIQAKDQFGIDTSRLEERFGVFFRALSSAPIQTFIGLNKIKPLASLKEPISPKKAGAMKELIEYIHGTSEVDPVLTDSRKLSKLGEILDSPVALDYLRHNRNLELAWALTGGEERRLVDNLKNASVYLDEALKDAHRQKENADAQKWIERCAGTMFEILKSYPEIEHKLGINRC